jgi:hypothetical protein
MKKENKNKEWEQAMSVFEWNPVKGAEIIVSLLQSKNDMVKLEAAIFILDRVLGRPKMMRNGSRKNST